MDMSEYCEPGDCSALNLTSCEKLFELENESFVPTFELYDEDGCFHTHQLRETTEYETYLKVRWVGGQCLPGTLCAPLSMWKITA